jgi:hypothetical protein
MVTYRRRSLVLFYYMGPTVHPMIVQVRIMYHTQIGVMQLQSRVHLHYGQSISTTGCPREGPFFIDIKLHPHVSSQLEGTDEVVYHRILRIVSAYETCRLLLWLPRTILSRKITLEARSLVVLIYLRALEESIRDILQLEGQLFLNPILVQR